MFGSDRSRPLALKNTVNFFFLLRYFLYAELHFHMQVISFKISDLFLFYKTPRNKHVKNNIFSRIIRFTRKKYKIRLNIEIHSLALSP